MAHLLQAAYEDERASTGDHMSKWMDRILGPTYHHYRTADTWAPAINFCENSAQYCVVVDLAGMSAEDIAIEVGDGQLSVSGQRAAPKLCGPTGEVCMHLMEIDSGPFIRKLELPPDAATEGIEASYRRGYLWIRIPKRA